MSAINIHKPLTNPEANAHQERSSESAEVPSLTAVATQLEADAREMVERGTQVLQAAHLSPQGRAEAIVLIQEGQQLLGEARNMQLQDNERARFCHQLTRALIRGFGV